MLSAEYDGIKLCEKCGEYTTGRLCRSCAKQEMIDNDSMAGYDAIHYDPVYGYDDDDDDDYPWGDEFDHDNGRYYDDDELVTVKLTPRARFYIWRTYILPEYMGRIRWRLWMLKYRVKGKLFRLLHKSPYDEIPF